MVVAVVPPLKTTGGGRAEAAASDEGGRHPAGLRGPDTIDAAADLACCAPWSVRELTVALFHPPLYCFVQNTDVSSGFFAIQFTSDQVNS